MRVKWLNQQQYFEAWGRFMTIYNNWTMVLLYTISKFFQYLCSWLLLWLLSETVLSLWHPFETEYDQNLWDNNSIQVIFQDRKYNCWGLNSSSCHCDLFYLVLRKYVVNSWGSWSNWIHFMVYTSEKLFLNRKSKFSTGSWIRAEHSRSQNT